MTPLVIVTSFTSFGLDRDAMAAAVWQRAPGLAPEMMENTRWKESA